MNLLADPLLLVRRVVSRDGHAARQVRIVFRGTGDLTSQLLESLALGLGDQQSGEDTAQHKQRVDLHDVVEPGALVGRRCASRTEGSDEDLGDDGADFAGGGGDAVGG